MLKKLNFIILIILSLFLFTSCTDEIKEFEEKFDSRVSEMEERGWTVSENSELESRLDEFNSYYAEVSGIADFELVDTLMFIKDINGEEVYCTIETYKTNEQALFYDSDTNKIYNSFGTTTKVIDKYYIYYNNEASDFIEVFNLK